MRIHPALAALLLVGMVSAASAGPRDYVGAAACGSCHPAILEAWRKTAHARASDVAVLGRRARDGSCLSCHATGDGAAARSRLPGVQCEACHGAGGAYAPDDVMRDLPLARALGLRDLAKEGAAACVRCHRSPATSPTPFDYARDWAKIAH